MAHFRFVVCLLLASLPFCSSQAQDTLVFRHHVKTNITQYCVNEYSLEYEYMTKSKFGFLAGAAYRMGNRESINEYWFDEFYYLNSNALTFSLGPTIDLVQKEKRSFYLNATFFYRKMWYDRLRNEEAYIFGPWTSYNELQSMDARVMGVKFQAGFRWYFPINKSAAFSLDVFSGLGTRNKSYQFTTVARENSAGVMTDLAVPEKSSRSSNAVSFQFGLKAGFVFR